MSTGTTTGYSEMDVRSGAGTIQKAAPGGRSSRFDGGSRPWDVSASTGSSNSVWCFQIANG